MGHLTGNPSNIGLAAKPVCHKRESNKTSNSQNHGRIPAPGGRHD